MSDVRFKSVKTECENILGRPVGCVLSFRRNRHEVQWTVSCSECPNVWHENATGAELRADSERQV